MERRLPSQQAVFLAGSEPNNRQQPSGASSHRDDARTMCLCKVKNRCQGMCDSHQHALPISVIVRLPRTLFAIRNILQEIQTIRNTNIKNTNNERVLHTAHQMTFWRQSLQQCDAGQRPYRERCFRTTRMWSRITNESNDRRPVLQGRAPSTAREDIETDIHLFRPLTVHSTFC